METFIGIILVVVVGYAIYKMLVKRETPAEAVSEVKKEAEVVVDKVVKEEAAFVKTMEEFVKAPEPVVVVNVEPIPEPVAKPATTKVVKKRVKKVAPVVVAPVVEVPVVVAPVKKVRKKKVK
jgi:hypothetical protein